MYRVLYSSHHIRKALNGDYINITRVMVGSFKTDTFYKKILFGLPSFAALYNCLTNDSLRKPQKMDITKDDTILIKDKTEAKVNDNITQLNEHQNKQLFQKAKVNNNITKLTPNKQLFQKEHCCIYKKKSKKKKKLCK